MPRSFDRYLKTQVAVGCRLEHRLTDDLTFRQNVRYTHMDLDYRSLFGKALLADQRTLSTNLAGNPLLPTAGQRYEAGIKYQPSGSKSMFTAAVFNLTQQNVSTADPVNTANTNTTDTTKTFNASAVTLFDAVIHADIGPRWRLQLNASNLLDKVYVAGCNSSVQCYYGNGRTIIGSISTRWQAGARVKTWTRKSPHRARGQAGTRARERCASCRRHARTRRAPRRSGRA